MYIITFTKQILHTMLALKVRYALTVFGIVWGTVAITLLLALGNGFNAQGAKQLSQIAEGAFFAIPGKTTKSIHGSPKGKTLNIKSDVIIELPKFIPEIAATSPMMLTRSNVNYFNKQSKKIVIGIASDFHQIRRFNLTPNSRTINLLDVNRNARVVILGNKLKTTLFGEQNAVGQTITIKGIQFIVIGTVKKPQGDEEHDFYNNRALIPYTTFIQLWGNKNVTYFLALPHENADLARAENNLRNYFASRYNFDPTDQNALSVFNTAKIFQFFKWFFIGMQIFLGFCGCLTLAVGGLGVTNIMFLIISERTREIGLRLAIGAKDRDIMFQFMFETAVIVAIGGILGVLLSYMAIVILSYVHLPEWLGKPTISPMIIMVNVIVLALLGMLAGYFPARRAANLDPIEALGMK